MRLPGEDKEQVPGAARPPGQATLPGQDQGGAADPTALHVPGLELHRGGQGLAGPDEALHRQARDPGGLPEGSPGQRAAEQQGELRPPRPPVQAAAEPDLQDRLRDAEEEAAVDDVVGRIVAVQHRSSRKGDAGYSSLER